MESVSLTVGRFVPAHGSEGSEARLMRAEAYLIRLSEELERICGVLESERVSRTRASDSLPITAASGDEKEA